MGSQTIHDCTQNSLKRSRGCGQRDGEHRSPVAGSLRWNPEYARIGTSNGILSAGDDWARQGVGSGPGLAAGARRRRAGRACMGLVLNSGRRCIRATAGLDHSRRVESEWMPARAGLRRNL